MDRQSMTQEQYKIEVLKSRIGKIVGDYEEIVANQAVELATIKSQLAATQEAEGVEQETTDKTE